MPACAMDAPRWILGMLPDYGPPEGRQLKNLRSALAEAA
jgi:hypothetical protein